MGKYVAAEVAKLMIKEGVEVKDAEVLVLGITFKENCPDVRNTKAVDVVHELIDFGTKVTIYDPCANPDEVQAAYNLTSHKTLPNKKFDAIVLTVAHAAFKELDLRSLKNEKSVVYDVKSFFNPIQVNKTL
jgi:UDP-N-acetyl-D-galactosamine dehydrogenase